MSSPTLEDVAHWVNSTYTLREQLPPDHDDVERLERLNDIDRPMRRFPFTVEPGELELVTSEFRGDRVQFAAGAVVLAISLFVACDAADCDDAEQRKRLANFHDRCNELYGLIHTLDEDDQRRLPELAALRRALVPLLRGEIQFDRPQATRSKKAKAPATHAMEFLRDAFFALDNDGEDERGRKARAMRTCVRLLQVLGKSCQCLNCRTDPVAEGSCNLDNVRHALNEMPAPININTRGSDHFNQWFEAQPASGNSSFRKR